VFAAGPAAWSALSLFELFAGPANTSFARLRLFGVFDPADEFISGEWRDALPSFQG
jgi:hypothetical protein